MTNETITLAANEGVQIDFSRIVYADEDTSNGNHSRPTWLTAHISAMEIYNNAKCANDTTNDTVLVTEDDLEVYLKSWLETTLKAPVAKFRWLWDKYRDFKAA